MIKTETFAKLFFFVSCTGLFMYVVLAFYTFHTAYTATFQVQKFRDRMKNFPSTDTSYNQERFRNDFKYILLWLAPNESESYVRGGQTIFIDYNCSYVNCYLTSNKYILNGDYRNFEAIIFNTSVIRTWEEQNLPQKRSTRQKFIFYSAESSDSNPVCNLCAENYFNWTWTYKLNSDIICPFIEVRDTNNIIVAPKENVNWLTSETNLRESIGKSDNNKNYVKPTKKALACIINKCETLHNRTEYATTLQKKLKEKLMIFDIYGCTFLKCPIGGCIRELKNKYHFYLAYEEHFAVDYVTAEVINAYDIGAIPIVVGGADYDKFLPSGSYINARNTSVERLAEMIEFIIDNPSIYSNFHTWRKHYSIRKSRQFEGICELCKNLNDEIMFNTKSAHKNFRTWWYSGSLNEKCKFDPDPSEVPLKGTLKESDIISYYDILHSKNRHDKIPNIK